MIINVEKLFAPKFYHDRKISSNGVDILQKWNSKAMVFICWTVIAEELVLWQFLRKFFNTLLETRALHQQLIVYQSAEEKRVFKFN